MNFIRNRNFRAGPQTSLEGFICPQNSDKQQKIKVFGRSGGVKIGKGIKPLVIPQNQMDSFIKWQNVDDENKLFIADDHMDFEMNDVVKIVDGKFAGLEGFVCRIKGQSRIGIVVNGVGTIFTAYIPKGMLEKK